MLSIRLEAKAAALKKQVDKGRREAGLEGRSLALVGSNLEKAKADYKASCALYTILNKKLEDHQEDFTMRKGMWIDKLKHNAKVIRVNFDKYLQRKGFAGTVKFDHHDHTLHLSCQTDNSDNHTKVNDVRQLSGGERSYTTLCLLLALGHVVSPRECSESHHITLLFEQEQY